MSLTNIPVIFVIISLIIQLFIHASSGQTETEPQIVIQPNEWKVIEEGWPIQDYFDKVNEVQGQFYYYQSPVNSYFSLTLKKSLIDNIDNQGQLFRISFKFWVKQPEGRGQQLFLLRIAKKTIEDISNSYSNDFIGQWMPRTYTLTFDELKDFELIYDTNNADSDDYRISAFKDFKIEYQTQTEATKSVGKITNDSEYTLNGWTRYMIPPSTTGLENFISFPINCQGDCGLTFQTSETNIKNAKLSFKYWIKGDAKITIQGKVLEESEWTQYASEEAILPEVLKDLTINVTTGSGASYAAITELRVVLAYTETADKALECNPDNCPSWKISEKPFWSKVNSLLIPTTEYYVPVSEQNSLIISKEEKLSETNVCLNIGYYLSTEKESKLNINYSIEGEDKSEAILEIKPKIGYKKSTKLCLRDLITSKAGKYQISLNSEDRYYKNTANNLHITIEDTNTNETWAFADQVRNYLISDNTSTEWSKQWIDLNSDESSDQEFDLTENPIKFKATTNSKLPTTAYLTTSWIKYDKRLHKNDSIFEITVSDRKYLTKFTVSPQVCDWLSHCTDVQLTPSSFTSKILSQSFTLKFNELENSGYIRLLLKVEYFKSQNSLDDNGDVEFAWQLFNFGDPCYQIDGTILCNGHGQCLSNPKTSPPNEPTCKCDIGYEDGQFCINKNFCTSDIEPGNTGNDACAAIDTECETLSDNFRCICDKGDAKIIWDGKECSPLTPSNLGDSWSELEQTLESADITTDDPGTPAPTPDPTVQSKSYYPTNKDNLLRFNFTDINTNSTAYDVCLNIKYSTSADANLILNYRFGPNIGEAQEIANINLLKTDQEVIDLCITDLYWNNLDSFSLELKIEANFESWNETTFLIKGLTPQLKRKDNLLAPYLNRWDRNSDQAQVQWKSIPSNLIKTELNDEKLSYKLTVTADTTLPTKIYLISNWIKNDQNFTFSETDNSFSILFTKFSINKYFKLKQSYIYVKNDNLIVTGFKFIDAISVNPTPEGNYLAKVKLLVPEKQEYPFKIILELEVLQTTDKSEWFIQFQNLTLGDPCFAPETGVPICRGGGQCVGLAPRQKTCKCSVELGGPNCEYKNTCNVQQDSDKEGESTEQHCSAIPSLPDNTNENCIVESNDTFSCRCPQNDYSWSLTNKRCLRNVYDTHILKCSGKVCDIFENLIENLEVSHKKLPALSQAKDLILPFYYTSSKDKKLSINVKDLTDRTDVCFDLRYQISQNSKLDISYESLSPFSLLSTQIEDLTNWFPSKSTTEKFCASNLTKGINKEFNINFNAELDDEDNDLVVLKISDKISLAGIDPSLKTELPYLTHWSRAGTDKDWTFSNQWQIIYPSSFWSESPNIIDTVQFKYSGTEPPQKSYLLSKWIDKGVDYKLRFKLHNSTDHNFGLNVITINEKQEENLLKVIEKQDNDRVTYNIPVPTQETKFRIGFSVDVEHSKPIAFSFESIDFGDPCVLDDTTFNDCSGNGTCTRLLKDTEIQSWDFNCSCKDNIYTGRYCEALNYCAYKHEIVQKPGQTFPNMNGEEYCKRPDVGAVVADSRCVNSYPDKFGKFSCNCEPNNKFWNYNGLKCANNLQCITHPCDDQKQKCKEPAEGEENPKCVCRSGFVDMGKEGSPDCQQIEPCNTDHRARLGLGPACLESVLADCKAYGKGIDDFMCICKEGFKTVKNSANKTETKCESIACRFPTLNDCDQICEAILNTSDKYYQCRCADKHYELGADNKECKPKSTAEDCKCGSDPLIYCNDSDECQCKAGYQAVKAGVNGTYECHPNVNDNDLARLICPSGKFNQTEETLTCICGEGFTLDEKLRNCKLNPICGENGVGKQQCDTQNALCIIQNADTTGYKCQCPPGKQYNGTEQPHVCINVCDYAIDGKKRSIMCEDAHGQCNPILIDPARNDDFQTVSSFCECGPGYTWNTDQTECLIVEYAALFTLKIKDTFTDENPYEGLIPSDFSDQIYFDLNTFTEDLDFATKENQNKSDVSYNSMSENRFKKYLSAQLRPALNLINDGKVWPEFEIRSYKLEGGYFECEIATNIMAEKIDLGQKLYQICIPASDPTQCFFMNDFSFTRAVTSDSDSEFSLVFDREGLKNTELETYKNCKQTDICGHYQYTRCEDDADESSLYSCLCNEEDFIADNKTIPVSSETSGKTVIMAICSVNLGKCSERCPATEFIGCSQSMPYKNESDYWVAPVTCKCKDEYLEDKEQAQCVSVCEGRNCQNGECRASGAQGNQCVCHEDWYGADCDTESKKSLGGWIAGITVLVVVCMALAAVAFIFAKRSKRNVNAVDNSQAMSQFSTTSYRVGQNAYNNDAFTRD